MGENSKIEWTHHTFNPWRGCTKVSAGCANCYAERQSLRNPRVLGVWGDDGVRVKASEAGWREPRKWNREAADRGVPSRVFCASMADVFEFREDVMLARAILLNLIHETRHLDWLLLTKRPEHIEPLLKRARNDLFGLHLHDARVMVDRWIAGEPPANVWLGVSVENQACADQRIPILLRTPAAKRFVSYEPALGPVDFTRISLGQSGFVPNGPILQGVETLNWYMDALRGAPKTGIAGLDWIIIGGESGADAREFKLEWVMQAHEQCKASGIPLFFKQMGRFVTQENVNNSDWPDGTVFDGHGTHVASARIALRDKKGGDMAEWPDDLRVREFPI